MTASARTKELFAAQQRAGWKRTDRVFGYLLLMQWFVSMGVAIWLSPLTWTGAQSAPHIHVWATVVLGALITIPPVLLVANRPGAVATRHAVVISQALWSALLIHLTGGRIETHFHIFGSLAVMAFYRDWKVLVTASAVVAIDHLLRGIWWPTSVYGIVAPESWRWLEHAGWVVFEDTFLIISIRHGLREMREVAQRTAELERSRSLVGLEVKARTAELAEARDSALDAAKAKAEFLANMSHEIRTPLNGILGFVDILGGSRLDDEQRSHLGTIRTSGQALLTIINDILDLSKMEAGSLEIKSIPFDIRETVEEVASLLAPRCQSRGVELICAVEGETSSAVLGDRLRLRQVVVNLLGNAVKFTRQGEVRIHVALEEVEASRTRATLTVADTGIGIPKHELTRIFGSFTQVDGSTTRCYGGTGLGLPISLRLINLMGGTISVESTSGTGSTFTVVLEFERGGADQDVEPTQFDLTGKRVLIVDTNPTSLEVLETMIADTGATCSTANDDAEAIRIIESSSAAGTLFDAAVVAMQKPMRGGDDVAGRLRDLLPDLPRVFLQPVGSAFLSKRQKPGDAVLDKPARRFLLLSALVKIVSGTSTSSPAEEVKDADVTPLPQLRVLVVDDNRVNQRVVLLILKRWGLTVDVADNGLSAVQMATSQTYDVILMDAQMPVMDGYEATRAIRAGSGPNRDTPVIAITARAMKGDRERCLRAGMDDHVPKPIQQSVLLTALRRVKSIRTPARTS